MRGSNSINRIIIQSQAYSNARSKEIDKEEQGESKPPVPTMASQPPDQPSTTFITSTLPVVQLVGLPPATPIVLFPLIDGNNHIVPLRDRPTLVSEHVYIIKEYYVMCWTHLSLRTFIQSIYEGPKTDITIFN